MKKYDIEIEKDPDDKFNLWYSTMSYLCYIVEKNTNIFINDKTNMIQVFDRFDSFVYEQEMLNKQYEDNKNKK